MVHACQKTGKCASPEVKKTAKSIKYKDAEEFASTKHEGLPDKVEKKKKKKKGKKHMFKSFKEWVAEKDKLQQETSTTTGDIASFKSPVIGGPEMDRKYPDKIALGDDEDEDEDSDEDEDDLDSLAVDEEHPEGCKCHDCKCQRR